MFFTTENTKSTKGFANGGEGVLRFDFAASPSGVFNNESRRKRETEDGLRLEF